VRKSEWVSQCLCVCVCVCIVQTKFCLCWLTHCVSLFWFCCSLWSRSMR